MKKYILCFFPPMIVFFFFSLLLFLILPGFSNPILFVRFHTFLMVYAAFFWIMACACQSYSVLIAGIAGISGGICLDYCLIGRWAGWDSNIMPSFLSLWSFLVAYLFFLSMLKSFLKQFFPCHLLLFLLFFSFSFGNIFFIKNAGETFSGLVLYLNPIVLVSLFFPGYDYIRGKFFYEVYPIASYLGVFRYPDFRIACIVYLMAGSCLKYLHTFFPKQAKQ